MNAVSTQLGLLIAILSMTCSKGDPPVPSTTVATISSFVPLAGGFSQAIAPDGGPITTLQRGAGATWWDASTPITAELPPGTPVDGSRWSPDGKVLHVGLGELSLSTRKWRATPSLASWNRSGPRGESPIKSVAWLANGRHVALLLETRTPSGKRTTEVVVVSAADGIARGRIEIAGAQAIAASDSHVLVAARRPLVLDLDGKLVAEPTPLPSSVTRVREGSGMFVAMGATGEIAVVRPTDGAVMATWKLRAVDAIPIAGGVASIDIDGVVRIGCLRDGSIRQVAEATSNVKSAVIQRVGNHLVVAGAGADPVRMASFTNPCH